MNEKPDWWSEIDEVEGVATRVETGRDSILQRIGQRADDVRVFSGAARHAAENQLRSGRRL